MNNARLRQQLPEQQPFRVIQRPNHYGEEYPVYNHDWFSIGIRLVCIVVTIVTWVLIW